MLGGHLTQAGIGGFSLPKISTPALGTTQPPIQRVPLSISGGKAAGA